MKGELVYVIAGELRGIDPDDLWWALKEGRCRYCAGDIAFYETGEKGRIIHVVACRRCLWKCKLGFEEVRKG